MLRLLLGMVVCITMGALVVLLVRGANGAKPDGSVWRLVTGVVSFQGAALFLVWRFVREHEQGWAEAFGFLNRPGRAVLLGVATVFIFFPLGQLLQLLSIKLLTWLHLDPVAQSAVEALRLANHGPGLIGFVLVTVVVAPLAEELVFRGILYPAVKSAGFPRLALWGTSVLFATIHFNLSIFLPLLLLALVLAWLYEKTNNLLTTIVAHSLFNTVNLVLFFLAEEFSRTLPAQP